MSNNTKAISFWNFLKENTIEIPIIQRDYAQGRLGKENLRKTFLADLKKALDKEAPYKDAVMKLDFVYGSAENGKLNPLDGQQRLTTLWLLHWYIALRAGELNEDNCKIFRKFTYETRISSREFCQNLCTPEYFQNCDGTDIVGFITKQTWFYSAWKQDPTIQSMLRMLGGTKIADKNGEDIVDGIEELFNCSSECVIDGKVKCTFKCYWEKLVSENAPIVFYHLPLQDFGLSDDLYIKMNARGKQLTSFENFKADLIGYITKQAEDESLEGSVRAKWKQLLDPKNGIPIKLDNDWTDIFWKNKSKDSRIDEIYFAFLNRFFWNELFIAKKSDNSKGYILDIGKGDESSTQENNNSSYKYLNNSAHKNDYDTTITYEGLDFYRYYEGTIPLSLFQKLTNVLNGYFEYSKQYTLPKCQWDSSFRFIPQYEVDNSNNNIEIENNAKTKILKVTTLNQVQRVVFFAICKYFSDSVIDDYDDESSLKQWMRVVWNLVSGEDQNGRPQIRSTQAMRTAMEFIGDLNSHNVYNSLASYNNKLSTSDFDERCKEEIAKAKRILYCQRCGNGNCSWEAAIIEAENHAFFKGAIRFLFTDGNGNTNWGDFNTKWQNAQRYFKNSPVQNQSAMNKEFDNPDLLKTLISRFTPQNYWDVLNWKYRVFNNYPATWKYYLLNNHIFRPVHELMMGNNSIKELKSSTDEAQHRLFQLSNTKLLDFVIKTIPYSWIRVYHGHKAIFPSGKGVFLDTSLRDRLLHTTEIKIPDYVTIAGTEFLYGSDIPFAYEGHHFQWQRDGFVRMINDCTSCSPILIDPSKSSTMENWYYFPTKSMDTGTFLAQLNCLIARYHSDLNGKPCFAVCRNTIP